MDVIGKRMLVVGLGRSGVAAALALRARGAKVIANDRRSMQELGPIVAAELEEAGVELSLGGHDETLFRSVDAIVVSPGVPQLPAIAAAEVAGVPIMSEVELASRFLRGTLIGITGTNGKSTVTSLVGAMCASTDRPCFVGGNLGTPLVEALNSAAAGPDGIVVAELSSFQLERVEQLRVHIAAILNVTDDHLDRYASFDDYAAAKGNIVAGQIEQDHAVAPAFEAKSQELVAGRGQQHRFGGEDGEVRVQDGHIVDTVSGLRVALRELNLTGTHNADNACAAVLLARLAGAKPDAIAHVLRTFKGLPHRMQFVRDLDGVRYYDDSKATNVGAAVASLSGLSHGVVLIAGGKDKGGSYAPLVDALAVAGRGCVLLGEAAPLMAEAMQAVAFPVQRASDMTDAVTRARRLAQPGDTVVLAPACSSFDMYQSYAQRGDVFQQAVLALGKDGAA